MQSGTNIMNSTQQVKNSLEEKANPKNSIDHPADEKTTQDQNNSNQATEDSKPEIPIEITGNPIDMLRQCLSVDTRAWDVYAKLEEQGYLCSVYQMIDENTAKSKIIPYSETKRKFYNTFYKTVYDIHIINNCLQGLFKLKGDSLDNLMSLSFTKEELINLLIQTRWGSILGRSHVDKLWSILHWNNDPKEKKLDFLTIVAMFLWLGFIDSKDLEEFKARVQAFKNANNYTSISNLHEIVVVPAPIAIDCVHYLITTNSTISSLFRGLSNKTNLTLDNTIKYVLCPSVPLSFAQRNMVRVDSTSQHNYSLLFEYENGKIKTCSEQIRERMQKFAFNQPDPSKTSWKALRMLAEGRFGTVLQAENKDEEKEEIAVTKLFKETIEQDPEGELSIWQHLNNVQGILPLKGLTTIKLADYHPKAALSPYCNLGSLESWLQGRKDPLSESQVEQIASQVFPAMERMHAKDVAHCDFAPRNILLEGSNDMLTVKISDFGHALYLPREDASEDREPQDEAEFQEDIFKRNTIFFQLHSLQAVEKDKKNDSSKDQEISLWKRSRPAG